LLLSIVQTENCTLDVKDSEIDMVKITQFQYTFVQNIILLYKTSLQKTVPVQIDDYDYQTKI